MTITRLSPRARVAVPVCLALTLAGCSTLRVFFPSHDHDTEPPSLGVLARPAVLIFTKTNGFRHEEAIPAGLEALSEIARHRGWSVFHTENGAVHNAEQLAAFDVVVWHNSSGDTLSEPQRAALRAWIEGGGGFVGIHGAGGDPSYDWPWYVETLIGAQFIGHIMGPQFQEAAVVVEDADHPAARGLPARWTRTDEWYSFDASPRAKGANVIATLDESSYTPEMNILFTSTDLRMGDHPIIWSQCIGTGRSLFTAMGHQASAYSEPEFRRMLEGSIAWAAGLEGTCEEGKGR